MEIRNGQGNKIRIFKYKYYVLYWALFDTC